ncbi:MAG: cysteine synthase A [Parvularculaceae bacterium]
MARFDSILETVGRTPSVRVNRLAPDGVDMFVKVEAFNPLGSVKARLALGVIEAAERAGALKPGQTVVEATSGNTGIGLAMVCAAKGYPLVVTMAETFSVERRRLMRFLGAKVILTPASERGYGMVEKAKALAAANDWFLPRQFENPANPDMHEATTGREIVEDFAGARLDYWVTGYGTGGTLAGVARVLKKERPETKIIVSEPSEAPLFADGRPQARDADGWPAGSHPAWNPHKIQGWTPDFIPLVAQEPIDKGVIDRLLTVELDDGVRWSRELAANEGIFTGVSGGSTFATAMAVAREADRGATVLCMLPDTGERYLSTPLFAGVEADMNADELALSRSTPGQQLEAG